jgi:hypothetical protein
MESSIIDCLQKSTTAYVAVALPANKTNFLNPFLKL